MGLQEKAHPGDWPFSACSPPQDAPSAQDRQQGRRGTKENNKQHAGSSVFFGLQRSARTLSCWRRLSTLALLQGSCSQQGNPMTLLSSTNSSLLAGMVWESCTRSPARSPTRQPVVLLVPAGRDENTSSPPTDVGTAGGCHRAGSGPPWGCRDTHQSTPHGEQQRHLQATACPASNHLESRCLFWNQRLSLCS